MFGDRNTPASQLENDFTTIYNNVCGIDPADLIFYAGRSVYLIKFLNLLLKRNCKKPVTVVTGSDASVLYFDLNKQVHRGPSDPESSPTSVIFVPLVHPKDLHPPQGPSRPGLSQAFITDFTDLGFPEADLNDGWAVMAHEAMFTAVRCTRMATGKGQLPPSPDAVQRSCRSLTSSTNSVPGATGPFQLDSTTGDRLGGLPPVVDVIGRS